MKTRESRGMRWSYSAGEYGTTVLVFERRGWMHAKIRRRYRSLRHRDREKAKAWAIVTSHRLSAQVGVQSPMRMLKLRTGLVYLLRDDARQLVKIGWTGNLEERLAEFRVSNPGAELIGWFPASRKIERDLHARFASQRAVGEWFNIEGPVARFLEYLGDEGPIGPKW